MSFALPSVKVEPSQPESFNIKEGNFGVPDLMTTGLTSAKSNLETTHPLINSELNYKNNEHKMNMQVLRNTQGLGAPLKISMELKAAKKVTRLPFLASSNVMYDSLTGRDLQIGPEDVFGLPEFIEVVGQPHAVVERSLGIL